MSLFDDANADATFATSLASTETARTTIYARITRAFNGPDGAAASAGENMVSAPVAGTDAVEQEPFSLERWQAEVTLKETEESKLLPTYLLRTLQAMVQTRLAATMQKTFTAGDVRKCMGEEFFVIDYDFTAQVDGKPAKPKIIQLRHPVSNSMLRVTPLTIKTSGKKQSVYHDKYFAHTTDRITVC